MSLLQFAYQLAQAQIDIQHIQDIDVCMIECNGHRANYPQHAVCQNHSNRHMHVPVERRRYTCCWCIHPRISTSDVRMTTHSHHRHDFFLSSDPLADTCASLRCMSKSNDAHKSRRVPRRRADDACGSTSRHSTFAATVTLCIRLRSLPHLSSAFRSSQRLANENRNGSPA